MRRELVKAARNRGKVTYGRLMKDFHLSRGLPLTRAIAAVDVREYELGAPGFAAIIVRKDTGFPGGGYFCDQDLPRRLRRPSERSGDPRLSPAEQEHVLKQQGRIWAHYGKTRKRED
jgi:hypothetical protein